MDQSQATSELAGSSLPSWAVLLLAAGALFLWLGVHVKIRPRNTAWQLLLLLAALAIGSVASWLVLDGLEHYVILEGSWGRAGVALVIATAVEGIILLYRFELQTLPSTTRRLIGGLRLLFVALLVLMLVEPVLSWKTTWQDERFVAVLVDVSGSMDLSDPQAPASEKLALAELLLPDRLPARPRPPRTAALDDAYYRELSAALRAEVDAAADRPRRDLARVVLLDRPGDKPGLLAQLARNYTVKLYRFAATPAETTVKQWSTGGTPSMDVPAGGTDPRQKTDLAAALTRAQADIPARQLAGMVVVGDGRHNAKTSLEGIGHTLGLQNAPVGCVLTGSTAVATDAAVTSVAAPRTVQQADRLVIRSELRFDGLKGQTAVITLTHDGKTLDTKKVEVPGNALRTEVELTDNPSRTGLRAYDIKIAPLASERTTANNAQQVFVHVTDDPTRLLLIEDRPRWEFRYLRALFAERDKSVRLQYVLLQPDWIAGAAARPKIHASASRPKGEAEASALPEKETDWFLFDSIILGDVSPAQLGPQQVEILKKYVFERGGRLIVIAGLNAMPHAFESSPSSLAEMLPVTCAPAAGYLPPAQTLSSPSATGKMPVPQAGNLLPAKERGFFVRLTSEGERNTITQLDADRETNRLLWAGLPEQHVRHPIVDTKDGAKVLAFAMPLEEPDCFRKSSVKPEEAERLAAQREQFMRQNALIVTRPYGAGQVLMLNFDGTWRFRYQKGDTYHHQFWGNVLRWATVDKLPSGTELVRLGTDRIVHEPEEPIVVRARLRAKNHAAVATKGAAVVLRRGAEVVLRKKLEPAPGSPGMYEADLGPQPPGANYQVALEIDDPALPDIAADAKGVTTTVTVAARRSLETAELSADRGTFDGLAQQTHGVVLSPADADSVVAHLGSGSREIVEEQRLPLWHQWPLFVVLLSLVTAEWLLRKKAGLT